MDNKESPVKIGIISLEGRLEMKALLISFVVGLFVGVVYGVIRVKSPAPPIVALLGLLGMVLGEQAGGWLLPKKIKLQTCVLLPLSVNSNISSNVRTRNL